MSPMALTNSYGLHCEMCHVWTHHLRRYPLDDISSRQLFFLTISKAVRRSYRDCT